jgi:hypothetical protein
MQTRTEHQNRESEEQTRTANQNRYSQEADKKNPEQIESGSKQIRTLRTESQEAD